MNDHQNIQNLQHTTGDWMTDKLFPALRYAFAGLIALAMLATLVLLLAQCGRATGAPAPLPKRESIQQARRLPEVCLMWWCGAKYSARFDKNGYYQSQNFGSKYYGSWHLDGDTLVICESLEGADWGPREYRIDLEPCRRRGSIREFGTGNFALKPLSYVEQAELIPFPPGEDI